MSLLDQLKRRDRARHEDAVRSAREAERSYWRMVKRAAGGDDLDDARLDDVEAVIEACGKSLDQFGEDVELFSSYLRLEAADREATSRARELNGRLERARVVMLDKARFLRSEGVDQPLRQHPSGFYQTDSASLRPLVDAFERARAEQESSFAVGQAFRQAERELRAAMGQDVGSEFGKVSRYDKMGTRRRKTGRPGTRPDERGLLLGDGTLMRVPRDSVATPREPEIVE